MRTYPIFSWLPNRNVVILLVVKLKEELNNCEVVKICMGTWRADLLTFLNRFIIRNEVSEILTQYFVVSFKRQKLELLLVIHKSTITLCLVEKTKISLMSYQFHIVTMCNTAVRGSPSINPQKQPTISSKSSNSVVFGNFAANKAQRLSISFTFWRNEQAHKSRVSNAPPYRSEFIFSNFKTLLFGWVFSSINIYSYSGRHGTTAWWITYLEISLLNRNIYGRFDT